MKKNIDNIKNKINMTKNVIITATILSSFFLFSCNTNSAETKVDKEKELLEKELELTKRELELSKKESELQTKPKKQEQVNKTVAVSTDFQDDPKLVLEEVFRAANEQDYSNLSKLCPPDKTNDGDTQKYICDIAFSTEQMKNEFISYFKNARITGEITYSLSSDGTEMAEVPFWFNHPSGESRSNETMNMVKVGDKWYLSSL